MIDWTYTLEMITVAVVAIMIIAEFAGPRLIDYYFDAKEKYLIKLQRRIDNGE